MGKCWGKTTNPQTDYWFPEDDDSNKQHKTLVAKAYCKSCPVRKECLEFALSNQEEYGIWGGMTPRERRTYIRKNRIYWNDKTKRTTNSDS